jgi:UDP-glucose 4-epimerase
VIPRFITAILEGRSPVIYGDGLQSRDFTYVANNVEANLLAAAAPTERVAGRVFNIACNDEITLLQALERINQICGAAIIPTFSIPRLGDVLHSRASISAATSSIGYRPTVDFTSGLALTVRYFLDQARS